MYKGFCALIILDLEELRLVFKGDFPKTQRLIPPFSHVTKFYGFDLLPNLRDVFGIPWDSKQKESESAQKSIHNLKHVRSENEN